MDDHDARVARVLALLGAARNLADAAHPAGVRLRERLLQTTRLSRAGIELALERCLERRASRAELESLVGSVAPAPRALILLSGNVFVAPLRAIAIGLAASESVVVRASRKDPALAEALFALVPGLFSLVPELQPEPFDHYFAYGSNETLATLRGALPPGVTFHAHGFGLGAVVVEARPGRDELAEARAIALDTALFDQRGCLSPRVICFVGDEPQARSLAATLASELRALELVLPLGTSTPLELAEARRHRDAATYAFEWLDAGSGSVTLSSDGRVHVPPPGRNLHVVRVGAPEAALAPLRPHLTCIGASVSMELSRRLAVEFPHARHTPLGLMQCPPLDGPVDLRPSQLDRVGR